MADRSNGDSYKRIESLEHALEGLIRREWWWKKVARLAGVCTMVFTFGGTQTLAFRGPSKPRPSSYETQTGTLVRSL